jgi:hypothetical protein
MFVLLGATTFAVCAQPELEDGHRHVRASEQRDTAESNPSNGVDQAVVEDLPLADGATQRVLYAAPGAPARGTIVMFPGGAGTIDIGKDGHIRHPDNFLVRTRDAWLHRGYGVVLVDALGRSSLRGVRSTPEYARVTQAVVRFAKQQGKVPVWVMGTSQGSIAAMNAAAHDSGSDIAGVILTESVSILGGSHETVFDSHPQDVHVPALVVANEDDACNVAPPSEASAIARSMTHAKVDVLMVKGGQQRSPKACGSLSPHGYYGIEDQVIDDIVGWMQRGRLAA